MHSGTDTPGRGWGGWPVWVGGVIVASVVLACIATLPWTLGADASGMPRYNAGAAEAGRIAPWWAGAPGNSERFFLGSDILGRSVLARCLAGGGVSLAIGGCAALLSVFIGTLYGAISGYAGGRVDAVMMRIVDVLYGLPYVLLVVLLAVASDAIVDEYVSRQRERAAWVRAHATEPDAEQRALVEKPPRRVSAAARTVLDASTLLVAIGGVSWLTMARVVRGQVLSLRNQPFVVAARALGATPARIFARHLLPNLAGIIAVYATLTVPQAILQESFLSFLGIGVKPPLPSWGTLASEGLNELNPYKSNWWLLFFPCLMLATTLLGLNFLGEGLRERLDPNRAGRA